MICPSCLTWDRGSLCDRCVADLEFAAPAKLGADVSVAAAYIHAGTARRLVHLLKYQGLVSAADPLAEGIAQRLPTDATALVPIPRAVMRKLRYGIDPAHVLAQRVAARTGLEVLSALGSRLWWPAHAGSRRVNRQLPQYRLVRRPPPGSILIDDVLTTGMTIIAAAECSGLRRAATATRAGR